MFYKDKYFIVNTLYKLSPYVIKEVTEKEGIIVRAERTEEDVIQSRLDAVIRIIR